MTQTLTTKDYSNGNAPTWCPGCGDYAVLRAIQRSLLNLQVQPEDATLVSGIGCSGKIAHYFGGYSIHSTHGRALTIAQGIKAARPELTVIAAGGDGDGYGIGVGHLVHAARRNLNITYVVMDNGVYGNTKGQTSPTSPIGYQSSTTPIGNKDTPINPLLLAWSSGASFIAQGFAGNFKHLEDLVVKGIQHNGFSLINVFSPCVVFNKSHGYDFYKENIEYYDKVSTTPEEFVGILSQSKMPAGVLWQKSSPSTIPSNQLEKGEEKNLARYLRSKII
ncbi:thiamine pyrophosphate-dependent enzyme [Alkalihalobacterium alkalinitrilicum]|uniref:thiamine pyrophosphate-dependent enzyme n=1 Tax=Alkalihalobacterium alkalinitrilicum TaxID=427920 RepID=UPI0009952336|nr:thiamine pyrophosphate-dependent enzyme [Alkalihalobacterium alkalinitrilicum]